MSNYSELVGIINHNETIDKFEKLINSSDMEKLIEKKIDEYLDTIPGKLIKSLGFNSNFIMKTIYPIIKDMYLDIAKLYCEIE